LSRGINIPAYRCLPSARRRFTTAIQNFSADSRRISRREGTRMLPVWRALLPAKQACGESVGKLSLAERKAQVAAT